MRIGKLATGLILGASLFPSMAFAQSASTTGNQEIYFDNPAQIYIINLDPQLPVLATNTPVNDFFGVECSTPTFQITFNFTNQNLGLNDGNGNFIQYSYRYNGVETVEGSNFPLQACVPINSNINNWTATAEVDALELVGKPAGRYTDNVTLTATTE